MKFSIVFVFALCLVLASAASTKNLGKDFRRVRQWFPTIGMNPCTKTRRRLGWEPEKLVVVIKIALC
jgi:hypothetical protein